MLSSRPNSSVGTRIASRMMTPPIVGVPRFWSWPSSPRSRISSPICLRRRKSMIERPKIMAISSDRMMAAAERNEMYWNIPEPGMLCIRSR